MNTDSLTKLINIVHKKTNITYRDIKMLSTGCFVVCLMLLLLPLDIFYRNTVNNIYKDLNKYAMKTPKVIVLDAEYTSDGSVANEIFLKNVEEQTSTQYKTIKLGTPDRVVIKKPTGDKKTLTNIELYGKVIKEKATYQPTSSNFSFSSAFDLPQAKINYTTAKIAYLSAKKEYLNKMITKDEFQNLENKLFTEEENFKRTEEYMDNYFEHQAMKKKSTPYELLNMSDITLVKIEIPEPIIKRILNAKIHKQDIIIPDDSNEILPLNNNQITIIKDNTNQYSATINISENNVNLKHDSPVILNLTVLKTPLNINGYSYFVPKDFVQKTNNRKFVWLKDSTNNKIVKRSIITGNETNTHIEVLYGLNPGDIISQNQTLDKQQNDIKYEQA